jgi:bifunctional UDP-N-acetylglucosamine pyrophosphorylase / glucosamine-1-phosphate N-acetyltransferase
MNHDKETSWAAIFLAAGLGTRMKSPFPKVLHPVAGRPMLVRAIEQVQSVGIRDIRVVAGYGMHLVETVVGNMGVSLHKQEEQKGTAHAVRCANLETLQNFEGSVLILNGDHPLIESEDLKQLLEEFSKGHLDLGIVTCHLKKPKDFGRIVRHHGQIRAIVEARDASAQTLAIREVNTGIYCVKAQVLIQLLPLISNDNLKKEFYLTDIVSLALTQGKKVGTLKAHPRVAFGVNSQKELAQASSYLFRKKAQSLMDQGVLLLDPDSTYIEETVTIGSGTAIYPNVFIRGQTRVGSFCSIEPHTFMVDCDIESSVHIKAGSYLERVKIQSEAHIGPYARLRPETHIGPKAHVGNFVEMKKVKFGQGSKVSHLSYLGDADIGDNVNIGCGVITCNYAVDRKKYKTVIGHNVFVGSDSQFVAPVTVGENAVIGSGSTITKDVPKEALAVARSTQVIKENWVKKTNK